MSITVYKNFGYLVGQYFIHIKVHVSTYRIFKLYKNVNWMSATVLLLLVDWDLNLT